ncbi:CocE/NonD family hydrolase [Zavarzinella formosa]|uniref:CocE/NonD family hydrolase n=1 Tax=Zavarzinella formosa TaxID=360055 RepID=UPI001EE68F2A|nr:CocE/NonD family hydrolase [Zavarzinella formosa]
MKRVLLTCLACLALCSTGYSQGKEAVMAGYTKYEYRIPMRDGVKLFTSVYVPKDDSKTYPMLMKRTPYSIAPYGVDTYPDNLGPSALFAKEGYIFVYQDVRGRWNSEGEFVNMRPHNPKKTGKEIDESSDTYDTIEWLIKNVSNNNGKVGTYGISYPGFYVSAGMIDAHPALKAASPQAPISDWFVGDDFHHNGVLFLPHCFNFMANFGKPRPHPITKEQFLKFDHNSRDGYDFFMNMGPIYNADAKYYKGDVAFWTEVMKHGNYDDFWKSRNLRQHMKNIKPAVMTVGGWFDAENLFGALETYKNTEKNSPSNATNMIVMGPWDHGGWSHDDADRLGPVKFNSKTGPYYREQIELPFFEYHLKGKGTGKFPEAWMFETGTNVWRKFDVWPPKQAVASKFYFGDRQQLLTASDKETGHDEFISDPAKPVPYIDKTNIGMDKEYMVGDQRFAARRPDVLVYQTEPVDTDTTIVGAIEVNLNVSTTGTDADWIVKVIDVYPGDFPEWDPNPTGVRMSHYQQLIRGEPFRGKFRNSFEKPEPFEPGKPAQIKFTMPDVFHTLRPGHRLMVQVQSTWFPLADRNPQKFTDIYTAEERDFKKATHRVYRGGEEGSGISVRVMK